MAFFTWRLWVSFYRQWQTMARQLDDNEAIQAASITIDGFRVEHFPGEPMIVYSLKNDGETRADQVTLAVTAGTIAPKDELQFF